VSQVVKRRAPCGARLYCAPRSPERRKMMQAWTDYSTRLRAGYRKGGGVQA